MAQVTQAPDVAARIEHTLAYAEAEWARVPEVAAEWESWDADEQLEFALEWGLREGAVRRLAEWHAAGRLTVEQAARFNTLCSLIAAHRVTADALFSL